jgi:hypothetical protein
MDKDEIRERIIKWLGKNKTKPRNPRRIKRILSLILKIWTKYPDLRLCQLIGNCFELEDLYYKEDDVLERKLKEIYRV